MDVACRCAHVGGLGVMKKHLVESTQPSPLHLSQFVRFFFYCLLEVSLMQTQLVDAHYLIESRQKKKLVSKFHTLKQFSKSKTSEKLLEEKLCIRGLSPY